MITAMLLKSLSKQILRGPESTLPKHWFVLDEFPAMEQVDSIHELVNRGRSKGASVLIGVQLLLPSEGQQREHDGPAETAQQEQQLLMGQADHSGVPSRRRRGNAQLPTAQNSTRITIDNARYAAATIR